MGRVLGGMMVNGDEVEVGVVQTDRVMGGWYMKSGVRRRKGILDKDMG